MARWLIVFGIVGAWCGVIGEKYENHTLIRLFPENEGGLLAVQNFRDPDGQVEILKRSSFINDSLDMLVPLEKMKQVEDYAWVNELLLEVKARNYGSRLMDADRVPRRRVMRNPIFEYNSYSTMTSIIEDLTKRYPDVVTLEKYGNSYEGRPMTLVKISSNPSARNPIIFVDAGIHAREWVAPAMALYLIHQLASNPAARADLNGVDWYILPVVNPDGYEYSRSSPANRMWRKTMSPTSDTCYGVDGNRNYGFKWGESGVSHNPCDKETYAGPRPFSEQETRIVKQIMMDNASRIKLYVSLHSYGQYLVYPWGYTGKRLPKQWKKLDTMARIVSAAVVRAGGMPFKVLSAGKWYPAAGGSDDFAFGGVGIPYSYTMELTDNYEFIFPESELRVVFPQFFAGFQAFGNEIRREFGRNRVKRELGPNENINSNEAKNNDKGE